METKFLEMMAEVFEMEDKVMLMSDTFRDYDMWDSLTQLSLIAEIDDVYNVVIDGEAFKKLTTLSDLYEAIQQRMTPVN
ncbi:acyl carrier protein [Flavobacterium lacus]|uniref:Acyl carrier protein n=1 Tax=Flavobacterium lacus TaxID=1353778 RepID=A0A328WPM3_9FLAO|nr:acyl carrier protein [Flavobacterium lacus]RAR47225.1 acyl carrier protein [Flavobacterium lacus]